MENKTNEENLETLVFLTAEIDINIFTRITIDKSLATLFLYAVYSLELYTKFYEIFGEPKVVKEENIIHYIFKYESAKIVLIIDNRI